MHIEKYNDAPDEHKYGELQAPISRSAHVAICFLTNQKKVPQQVLVTKNLTMHYQLKHDQSCESLQNGANGVNMSK